MSQSPFSEAINQLKPAITALAPLSWGTTYLVTSELLPPGRPLLAAVLRALPAGLLLLALTRTSYKPQMAA